MTEGMQDARRGELHFDVLDGQRGIAAFMVLLGHASAVMLGPEHAWVQRKGLAVVFFFMLSGFVVASAYQKRLRSGMSFRDFILRRMIRLYPLIVLGVLMGTAWFALFDDQFWNGHQWMVSPAINLLGLPSLHTPFSFSVFPVNPPEWSLFFEMLFYVIFAVVMVRASTRVLVLITSICAIGYGASDWRYVSAIPFYLLEFEAGASFCGGLLLWDLYEKDRLPTWQVPSWSLALTIIIVCLCPLSLTPLIDYAALLIAFPAVLILGAAKGRRSANPAEKLLGDLSFPVYILHWPFLMAAHRIIQPQFGAEVAIASGMISATAFAWVALRVYDEPFRSWLVKRLLSKQPYLKHMAASGALKSEELHN